MATRRKEIKYYTCCECAFFEALYGKSPHWLNRIDGEGKCVAESKSDPCPLDLPFVKWYPVEVLPEPLEEENESSETEDQFSPEDLTEHYSRFLSDYRIPHNQFTEEEYEE